MVANEKRHAKEVSRKALLEIQLPKPAYNRLECDVAANLIRVKNVAAKRLLYKPKTSEAPTVIHPGNAGGANKEGQSRKHKPKTKRKSIMTKSKSTRATKQARTSHRVSEPSGQKKANDKVKVVKDGCCQHCKLSDLLMLTKVQAKWYMVDDQYLVGKACKDCGMPVRDIVPDGASKHCYTIVMRASRDLMPQWMIL